jgi:hypothetical protein
MPEATLSGADFKKQLREGKPKMGLPPFLLSVFRRACCSG